MKLSVSKFKNAALGTTTTTHANVLASGLPTGYTWSDLTRINISGNLLCPTKALSTMFHFKLTAKVAQNQLIHSASVHFLEEYTGPASLIFYINRNELVSSVLNTVNLASYSRNSDGSYTVAREEGSGPYA